METDWREAVLQLVSQFRFDIFSLRAFGWIEIYHDKSDLYILRFRHLPHPVTPTFGLQTRPELVRSGEDKKAVMRSSDSQANTMFASLVMLLGLSRVPLRRHVSAG